MKLLLLKYNNYYNRILKGYDNIDGYKLAVGTSGYAEIGGVNFNPRDGINTYHTINTPFEFDYMLVFDDTEPYTIRSRWFVIDSQYENLLQRTVTLRRDVLYDYSGSYGTAPAFIEKGAVDADDKYIFNDESMVTNKILRGKYNVTDETNSAWIVGYVATNFELPQGSNMMLQGTTPTATNAIYASPLSGEKNTVETSSYLMFVMPYGTKVKVKDYEYKISESDTMRYLALLTAAFGTFLYDVQLLPFCPLLEDSGYTWGNGMLTKTNYVSGTDGFYIYEGGEGQTHIKTVCFWGKHESRSFRQDVAVGIPPFSTALEKKIYSQLWSCRIVSPNYSGGFEFSPAKAYGSKIYETDIPLNIRYTMRPYQPYIRISPTYNNKGLYGNFFAKETRGLICQGDFSLPQVGDAWKQYQINNKSYMNVFNRTIDNLELQQEAARLSQITGSIGGAIGAGAGAGMVFGPAGAAVGAAASVVGGTVDYFMSEKLRQKAIDFTRDNFRSMTENIKAQPYTLSKVCSFDIDSNIFPFIEVYSASDEEIAAFKKKIEWNGMTVNRIGTFNEFKARASTSCRYIKAQIIRLADLHEELHTANAISEELYKGVYLY